MSENPKQMLIIVDFRIKTYETSKNRTKQKQYHQNIKKVYKRKCHIIDIIPPILARKE